MASIVVLAQPGSAAPQSPNATDVLTTGLKEDTNKQVVPSDGGLFRYFSLNWPSLDLFGNSREKRSAQRSNNNRRNNRRNNGRSNRRNNVGSNRRNNRRNNVRSNRRNNRGNNRRANRRNNAARRRQNRRNNNGGGQRCNFRKQVS